MLIYQRKAIWHEDTLKLMAAWLGLRPGITLVDVGCGLGYLGFTYWPFFGQGGHYCGIDASQSLLSDAAKAAQDWATGGRFSFAAGDAYSLPIAGGFADVTTCQALLIHLDKPERALAEMVRVTEPGGLVVCHEPDNVSRRMGGLYSSLPQLDIDDHVLAAKVSLLCKKGRIALGLGDNSVGREVPHLMKKLNLVDVQIRNNDKVAFLEPPYESADQAILSEKIKKGFFEAGRQEIMRNRERKEFLAGGGDPKDYERYLEIDESALAVMQQQIAAGEFFMCTAQDFYVAKGRKKK
jgi:ubiquinone/menaquinone biosynthesis C-methylase UbiE